MLITTTLVNPQQHRCITDLNFSHEFCAGLGVLENLPKVYLRLPGPRKSAGMRAYANA